jgi:HPr kinase/phosphorylase
MAAPDAAPEPEPGLNLHATCVAWPNSLPRGLLILGTPGAGKSTLGLQLMALGCRLVADDRTLLTAAQGRLVARCPPPIRGLIEARGLGLLRADPLDQAPLVLAVDLDQTETARLPQARHLTLLGVTLPLVHSLAGALFPAALLQYLKAGREVP